MSENDLSKLPPVATDFNIPASVDVMNRRAISSPVGGVIHNLICREGMTVHAGQVLAKIINEDAQLREQSAERHLAALLAQRNTELSRAPRRRQTFARVPPTAAFDISAARTSLQYAELQLQAARNALVNRTSLRAAVRSADNNVKTANQAVAASAAQVSAAESELVIESGRHDAVTQLYQLASASKEELRSENERYTEAIDKVNAARAAYNRELLGLSAAQDADTEARSQWRNADDLKNQVIAAEDRVSQAAAAYRRAQLEEFPPPPDVSEDAPPDVAALDTEIVQAQGDVLAAREDLKHLDVLSPMNGTISELNVDEGQSIAAAQLLGYVVNLSTLKVTADVRPEIAQFMLPGHDVKIVQKGPPDRDYVGKVVGVGLVIDPQAGTQKVTISVYDPTHSLAPGSQVSIQAQKAKK